MEVLGVPPKELLERATRRKKFFDDDFNPMIVPNSRGRKRYPGKRVSLLHVTELTWD